MLHTSSFLMHQLSHVQIVAAAADQDDVKPYGGAVVFGVIFVIMGGLAYSGKWRSWSTSRVLRVYRVLPIALGWAGVGSLVLAVANVIPEPLAEILGFPALAFIALCVPGMAWLPSFMLPRWYRLQRGLERRARRDGTPEMRAAEQALSSSDASGGALHTDSSAEAGFAAKIGGSVGGVGAPDAARSKVVDETGPSEAADGARGPGGASPV